MRTLGDVSTERLVDMTLKVGAEWQQTVPELTLGIEVEEDPPREPEKKHDEKHYTLVRIANRNLTNFLRANHERIDPHPVLDAIQADVDPDMNGRALVK